MDDVLGTSCQFTGASLLSSALLAHRLETRVVFCRTVAPTLRAKIVGQSPGWI